jgi:ribonuclease III
MKYSIQEGQTSVVSPVKPSRDFTALFNTLTYRFNNEELLETALTHRSVLGKNNERLEFLGDSILNLAVAERLFFQFPTAAEGDLSRLRASLVKGDTLADLANEMNLGEYLNLGEGELKSGGCRRPSILADAVEAIIGAIYLDASMDVAKNTVLSWLAERLDKLTLVNSEKDAKTLLQEWLQARKQPLPKYDVIQVDGEAHSQLFTIRCAINAKVPPTVAMASNRKIAEKEAANLMLKQVQGDLGE